MILITIKDIAKLAGVSYSTVSKALNDDPRIKPATKQKVLAVAEKHQYRKNMLARQLSTGRSNIIGFVLDEPEQSVILEHLRPSAHRAEEAGISDDPGCGG